MGHCEGSLEERRQWLNCVSANMRALQDLAEAHGMMDALHHSEIIHEVFNMLPAQFKLNMCEYIPDLTPDMYTKPSVKLTAFWKWLPRQQMLISNNLLLTGTCQGMTSQSKGSGQNVKVRSNPVNSIQHRKTKPGTASQP